MVAGRMPVPIVERAKDSADVTDRILDNMYRHPEGPPKPFNPVDTARAAYNMVVRMTTNRMEALDRFTEEVAKSQGRPLQWYEKANLLQRLNPASTAAINLQQQFRPAVMSVGKDVDWLSNLLTYQHNIDVATATGNPVRAFSGGRTLSQQQGALALMPFQMGTDRFNRIGQAADQIYGLVRDTWRRKHDAGLISDELYNELTDRYPHFVPTRILDFLDKPEAYRYGKSVSVRDKEVRELSFEGTQRWREDPLAWR